MNRLKGCAMGCVDLENMACLISQMRSRHCMKPHAQTLAMYSCKRVTDLLSKLEPLSLHFFAVCLEEAVQLSHGCLHLLVGIAEAVLDLHDMPDCT